MSSITLCGNNENNNEFHNDKILNAQKPHNNKRIILFPFNNTEASREIYQWALENYFQSEIDHIYLLSVIKTPCLLSPLYSSAGLWMFGAGMLSGISVEAEYLDWQRRKEAEVRSYLGELKNELSSRNITSSILIIEGNPRDEILNMCNNIDPDVVLMGTSLKKNTNLLRSSSIVYDIQKKLASTTVVTLNRDDNNNVRQLNNGFLSKQRIREMIGYLKYSLRRKASYSSFSTENTYTKLE
ncbi:4661_t:CDS:2 [Ambispora leptoticha]|uniref:4661_t:CDS:1 n=1 Tax=Ambispora leptoticha TaxID=144679 RepID=A0A9N9GBZ6_9GLOM|nr:4661_t:CDS:2 [Ambispora leptoticha]